MTSRALALSAAIASLFVCFAEVHAAQFPSAGRTLTLKTVNVYTSQPPAPQSHAPIPLPRHFANPAMVGQVKAALALGSATSRLAKGGSHGKPGPTPTPTPSPTPSPTVSPVPISSGAGANPVPTAAAFDAMNLVDGGGYVPPDTTVGAGSGYVVEAVNSLAEVYDTNGNPLASVNTTACTTDYLTDSVTDPRVLYDAGSQRWFISTATFSPIGDASWNLLVSSGSDPSTSTWSCLIIPTSNIGSGGNFPDFPKIGISADKVVLTGDAFTPTGHGHSSQSYKFVGTEFVVINKSQLTPGGTVDVDLFAPPQGDFAIEPAQELGSAPATLYMAAVNSALASASTIEVWRITGVPSGTTVAQASVSSLPIAPISIPPNAQQQGTGTLIDTNDDSLLDAVYREDASGSPGSLWVSANDACQVRTDTTVRSCLRFINVSIDTTSGNPIAVSQDFDYGDPGTYYYYPAIRTDIAGDLFASFSGSSGSSYASAYAGLQIAGSSNLNMLTNLSVTRAGDSPYTVSPPRWGDYSGAAIDPSGNAWLGAEYATSYPFFGSIWGTAITETGP